MYKYERAARESFGGFVENYVSVFRNPAVKSYAIWFSGVEDVDGEELCRLVSLVQWGSLGPSGLLSRPDCAVRSQTPPVPLPNLYIHTPPG